ncbi:MAG TPA: LacI family DNA-binding transcriptional regulator [Devosiaceae bacterium]|jgi:LacI family transcriptional regulator
MKRSSRGPTIGAVAAEVGVARSTVSRAFSQPERLTEETVRRVLTAAAKLGYAPDPVAQALSTGRSKNIALIVPDIANPFFPPLIRAAQRMAEASGYCVFLGDSDERPEREVDLVERFVPQVEGLVLVSSRLTAAEIERLALRRPLVLINQEAQVPRVLIDSGTGIAEGVAHLAALGHRHVVYVGGPANSWANRQRQAALERAARAHGLRVEVIAATQPDHEAARRLAPGLTARGATAAFAFDDLLAQGLLFGLLEAGIRVPEAFSVIGCDDVLGAMTYPALTTVSGGSTEAAEIAIGLLTTSPPPAEACRVVATQLVLRGTTAPPLRR